MKVIDLEGREHPWPPQGCEVKLNDIRNRSSLHLRCREILGVMYPTQPVLEEVPVPGMRLFCDFYLPMRQVVVEVHGEQHYNHVKHFHKTKRDYAMAKTRDRRKIEWCHMNNLRVAILPFSEDDDEWQRRIEEAND